VHRPHLRGECRGPELGFGVITWIFPSVLGAGLCALFAYRIGLARHRRVEPSQSLPVLELIPIADAARRPVPRGGAAGAAPSDGHPCRDSDRS